MRRVFYFFFAGGVGWGLALAPARAMTVAALQADQASGAKVTVIDVRSPRDFAREHIPGAINVPAALCPRKTLPALGVVVVCGDGLLDDDSATAAAALAANPGLKVEMLDGGLLAWKSASGLTTRGAGFKREEFNYISYARLKAANPSRFVLVDLRKAPARKDSPLTDLAAEFPGARRAKSLAEVKAAAGAPSPVFVLIDSGDGSSEAQARLLRASGVQGCAILMGGELILARHGEAGLERAASSGFLQGRSSAAPSPKK